MVSQYKTRTTMIDQRGLSFYKNIPALQAFQQELEKIGYSKDSEDELQLMKRSLLIECRALLESYGLTQEEASKVFSIIEKSYKLPLSPLTFETDEWRKVSEEFAINKRYPCIRWYMKKDEIYNTCAMNLFVDGILDHTLEKVFIIEEDNSISLWFNSKEDILIKERTNYTVWPPQDIHLISTKFGFPAITREQLDQFLHLTNYSIKPHVSKVFYYL